MQALGINAGNLLVNIICFAIAYLVIAKLVVKPIQNMVDKRKAVIEKGLEDAKAAASARETSEADCQKLLDEARAEADQILANARVEADKLRADFKTGLEDEIEAERAEMVTAMEHEKAQMLADMKDQIIDLTIGCAQKMVGESLIGNDANQRKVTGELLNGMKAGNSLDLNELPDGIRSLTITTAVPLEESEKETLLKLWKSKLADDAKITYKNDLSLLGGMILLAGDKVIDLSVSGRTSALKKAVQ